MSRHRNIRNLRLDDYLDDGYDDDYYDQEEEEDQEEDEHYRQYHYRPQEQTHNQNHTQSDGIDQSLLDEMVLQFRSILNDNSLAAAQVDQAIRDADYDWETALATLRSQQTVEARQAEPSAIAQLLAVDDNENDNDSLITDQRTRNTPSSSSSSAQNPSYDITLRNPDYSAYVDDSGTAFTTDSLKDQTNAVSPFQFDQPSPDDVIREKQARGATRTTPALRLPKPASGRSGTIKDPEQQSQSQQDQQNLKQQGQRQPHQQQKKKPLKPLKPARSTRPSPSTTAAPNLASNNQVQQRLKKLDLESRIKSSAPSVSVVVAGHVDAGKSTLVGHLIKQVKQKEQSISHAPSSSRRKNAAAQDLAWDTDDDRVERERGVTIDIASRLIQRPGPPPRTISLIDAPGHRDFVPAMIVGAAQSTAALLVVDASLGEFEAGFSEQGQTREHAVILKSFGISSLIVVVNKMDTVNFDKGRYEHIKKAMLEFLKANGWKTGGANTRSGMSQQIKFVPVSGREGINLTNGPAVTHPLSKWYSEKYLLKILDDIPLPLEDIVRKVSDWPTRILITDFYRSASLAGQAAVTGRIVRGSVTAKDRLTVMPGNYLVTVRAVSIATEDNSSTSLNSSSNRKVGNGRVGNAVSVAIAGVDNVSVSLGLSDLPDGAVVASGSVLCDPEDVMKDALRIRARILVTGGDAIIMRGTRGLIHVGGAAEEAYVAKLVEYKSGKKRGAATTSTNAPKKRVPLRLVKGDIAIVEINFTRSIAVETTEKCKELGRFAFRQGGWTVAVGIVAEVLETDTLRKSSSETHD